MKLTAQEAQLVYEALRVVNAALTKHKVDLIREYNETRTDSRDDAYLPEPKHDELDKAFDVSDALSGLLRKLEKGLTPAPKKKRKPPKDGKNERRA